MANKNSSVEKLRPIPEAAETKTEKKDTAKESALELALAISHHLRAQREAAEGVKNQTEHTLGSVAKLAKEQGDAAQQTEVARIKADLAEGAAAYAKPVNEIGKKLDAARAKIAAADEGDIEMGDEDIVSAEPSHEGATKRALERAKLVAKDLSDRRSRNDKIIRELNPIDHDAEISRLAQEEHQEEITKLAREEETEESKKLFAERTKQFETGKNKQVFAERNKQFEAGKKQTEHNAEIDQLLRDEVATDADKKVLITEATSFDDLRNTLEKIADYGSLSGSNKKEIPKADILKLASRLNQIRDLARKDDQIVWKRTTLTNEFTNNLGLRDKVVLLAEQAQRAAFATKNKDVRYDKLVSTDTVQVDETLDADRLDSDAKRQEAARADTAANDFRKKIQARKEAQDAAVDAGASEFRAKLEARKQQKEADERAKQKAHAEKTRAEYYEKKRVDRVDKKSEGLQTKAETRIDEETPQQVQQAEAAQMERTAKSKGEFVAELKRVSPRLDSKTITATGEIFQSIYNGTMDRKGVTAQLALSMASGVSEGQMDQVLAFLKGAGSKIAPNKGEIAAWISSHAKEMKDEMDESGETARQEKIAADKKKAKDAEAKKVAEAKRKEDLAAELQRLKTEGAAQTKRDRVRFAAEKVAFKAQQEKAKAEKAAEDKAKTEKDFHDRVDREAAAAAKKRHPEAADPQIKANADKAFYDRMDREADAASKKREAAREKVESKVWGDILDAMDKKYMANGWTAEQRKYGPHGAKEAETDPAIENESRIGAAMALIESGKTLAEAQKSAEKFRPTFRYMPDASHMAEAQRRLSTERANQPAKKPGFFGRLFGRGK